MKPSDAQLAFQRASYRQLHGIGRLPRYTDDELRQFVLDFIAGRIFTSAMVEEHTSLGVVFAPLAFGALSRWEKADLDRIGIVYEYIDKAGPLGVNGQPMFFSMRLMDLEDWDRCLKAGRREIERQKEIEI